MSHFPTHWRQLGSEVSLWCRCSSIAGGSITLSGVECYCKICQLAARSAGRKLGGIGALNPGEKRHIHLVIGVIVDFERSLLQSVDFRHPWRAVMPPSDHSLIFLATILALLVTGLLADMIWNISVNATTTNKYSWFTFTGADIGEDDCWQWWLFPDFLL